jgi:hypothetical protein
MYNLMGEAGEQDMHDLMGEAGEQDIHNLMGEAGEQDMHNLMGEAGEQRNLMVGEKGIPQKSYVVSWKVITNCLFVVWLMHQYGQFPPPSILQQPPLPELTHKSCKYK